uniref:4-trimethylaminobutyraldehyde dehydrogenase n=1 Tax=Ciona intestinalis TaxID=7719 RepID=UPI000180B0DC|nr:4-trimethylaminobutyraldehyde dehydrogenase [Ciona intestinalis]|eukprot:XP_018670189.1 4-trimethylaminobutyraldehyde dehydrogenase [Ciona intestinalis]
MLSFRLQQLRLLACNSLNKSHRNIIRSVASGTYNVTTPLNFIGGQRVETEESLSIIDVIEPATGKVMCQMHECGATDVNNAVNAAKQAQLEWGKLSGFERGKILSKSSVLLKQKQEEIARMEVYDTGKPIQEARVDVQTAIDSIEYFSGIASTLCGQHFSLPNGSFGYTRREPLGVVAAIGAWNYPIQIAAWKAAPALATGNAVVCKPSQFTPLTAVALAEVFIEGGLPSGLFNVVQGAGETGNHLTRHPDVAKVTFTGSIETGSKVMQNCAADIRHVTLELGGKSPLILFGDCDITNAVNGALMANFLSQGQVCSNGTRVFIQDDIYDEVVTMLVERTLGIKHGDPHHEHTKMGAMMNEEHAHKVMGFIERAKKEGAEVLCGGELVQMEDPVLRGGSYISPCIIRPSDSMEISREELFGPVMNVYSFKTEDEVIRRANDSKYGLASGVFTKDIQRAHRVAASMQAGSCYINNYNIFPIEMPFGGYKKSGLGRENGTVTVDYFTQLKTVYVEMNDVECSL